MHRVGLVVILSRKSVGYKCIAEVGDDLLVDENRTEHV